MPFINSSVFIRFLISCFMSSFIKQLEASLPVQPSLSLYQTSMSSMCKTVLVHKTCKQGKALRLEPIEMTLHVSFQRKLGGKSLICLQRACISSIFTQSNAIYAALCKRLLILCISTHCQCCGLLHRLGKCH